MNNLQKALVGAGAAAALAAGIAVSTIAKPKPPDGERVRVSGQFTVYKVSGGAVVESTVTPNTVVAVGMRHLWRLFSGDSASHYDTAAFLGVGNSPIATDTSMTGLQGDSLAIKNVDSITYGANYIQYFATFTSEEGNFTWREFALFNDSGAIMFNRATTNHTKKTTADTWLLRSRISIQ